MKTIRFFFDWGTNQCLWDHEGLMNLDRLGISEPLCLTLKNMGDEMQSALNWDDPTAPSPWSPERRADFARRARNAYEQLCKELNGRYEIIYSFTWFEQ